MKKNKLKWITIQKKVNDLIPFDQNPRKMSDEQFTSLAKSLETFNIVEIPAIDFDNKIISGHQRIKALQLLGRGEEIIDVRYPNRKLTDEEYRKYLITSNKVHGEWDEELLHDFFEPDLLLDSGFSHEEIEEIFPELLSAEDDDFDVEKEIKNIKQPKAKLGKLYQLGPHKLYCGDSTKLESVQKLVGDEKIDLVYCDPIYNINLSYKSGIGGTKNYGGSVNDKRTDEEYEKFLSKTIENAVSVCNKKAHIFYYCDETYVPMVTNLYKKHGIDFKRICIWLKGIANPVPQIAFSKVYEPCVYGTIGKKPYLSKSHTNYDEVLNKDIGTGQQMIENFMSMIDVWAVQRLGGNSYTHPTEKPVTLHHKPFTRCTKVGDNILSLFGGSGGDLIAAHQLKRKCFMVEIDPVFVDLIINRFEKLTGIKAVEL